MHDVEWSGTLFYTVEGSLDDGTFKATCVDICVMDIGTGGYTEFKDTEDIITYRLEHDLLHAGIYEALIHSHNNMSAFFSRVDVDTLISEGTDLNHFLSLIVCNAGQYVARITRKLKSKVKAEARIVYTKTVEYDSYENQRIVISDGETSEATKVEEREEVVIEYFELNINKPVVEEPFKELDERLDEIKRSKFRGYRGSSYAPSYSGFGQGYQPVILNAQGEPYRREIPAKEPADPRQLSMFAGQEEEEQEGPVFPPKAQAADEEPFEFYTVEKVPFQIVKSLCTQLLFGSILASDQANLNLNTWVEKMDKVYAKRFGNLDDPASYESLRLRNWIEQFLEHLIGYSVDKKYEDEIADKYGLGDDYEYEDSDAFIHLYACDMITFLEDLPDSDVKDMMIEELTKLMPSDYAN